MRNAECHQPSAHQSINGLAFFTCHKTQDDVSKDIEEDFVSRKIPSL